MRKQRKIHIAILDDCVDIRAVEDALSPIVKSISIMEADGILYIAGTVDEPCSDHPNEACALTANLVAEILTEGQISEVLDKLDCRYSFMDEQMLATSLTDAAKAEGLGALLGVIHLLEHTAVEMATCLKTQDAGFAIQRALFYAKHTLLTEIMKTSKGA